MAKKTRFATRLALRWAERHAKRHPPTEFTPLESDTTARILVVNTTGIGDTIFATAAIADLSESFPKARIDVFVDRRRVALVENNPRLADVVTYHGKYKRMRTTVKQLRRKRYDVALISHANDPDVVPLVAAGRPKAVVGYEDHTFSMLYAFKAPAFARTDGHTIDSRLNLCKQIGANGTHWHTELYPDEADFAQADDVLNDAEIERGAAVALNVGGSLASKRWPSDHWVALAMVLQQRGTPVVFVGGPTDAVLAELVRSKLESTDGIHFMVGTLPFMTSTALLTRVKALVTPDTGLMQAALAMNIPTLCLFGPDNPEWTGPYQGQPDARVILANRDGLPEDYNRKHDQDAILMQRIDVDEVLSELDALT